MPPIAYCAYILFPATRVFVDSNDGIDVSGVQGSGTANEGSSNMTERDANHLGSGQ